jgi:RNA polymerase subunit RPABC4/transcription elongation factor Spt4
MVSEMAEKCPVCGLSTDEAVCSRCGTILLPDRAICPKCGKMFPGRIAVCDACGAGVSGDLDDAEEEAVKVFALVPGMDERTARRLWARGFRDFSE